MTNTYDSSAIEVLTGLEPVRKRPGLYTTTERPNHLAQEVIDNSADEAIAGYCDEIVVTLHDNGSVSVADDGRGMPVDRHAKEGVTGVEVILTRLHAGASSPTRAIASPAGCTASASPSSTRSRSVSRYACAATATSTSWTSPTARRGTS